MAKIIKFPRQDNASTKIADDIIRHQIQIQRLATHETNVVVGYLNDKVFPDLMTRLNQKMKTIKQFGFDPSPSETKKLNRVLDSLEDLLENGINDAFDIFNTDLIQIGQTEADWMQTVLKKRVPPELDISFSTPTKGFVENVIKRRPMTGKYLKDWVQDFSQSARRDMTSQIRIGLIEGEAIPNIARRIQGTVANHYTDGTLAKTRRDAEAIVRTATNHVTTSAREETYAANNDVIKAVEYLATLDSRTTPTCAALDGKTFPIESGPRPPQHINCRSTTAPVLKSLRELGIPIDTVSAGTRQSMNGAVPEELNYNSWLRKMDSDPKTKHIVDDALGKGKAKIFRDGVPVTRFVDRKNQPLTIAEIRQREGLNK